MYSDFYDFILNSLPFSPFFDFLCSLYFFYVRKIFIFDYFVKLVQQLLFLTVFITHFSESSIQLPGRRNRQIFLATRKQKVFLILFYCYMYYEIHNLLDMLTC